MQYKLLGELVNRKIGYGIVQPGQSVPNGVPVIKVNNLIAGLNSPLELDTTTHENDSKYSRTRLHGGELIISVVGTIGKTAIVPKSFDGCNLVRATALIDIDNELIAKWVKYYIDSSAGQSYIEQNLNTTVQPTLNIKSLVQMPIPFFDESIMKGTVSLLSSLDDKIRVNNKINDNLYEMVNAYYTLLFKDNECEMTTVGNYAERIYSGGTPTTSNAAYWNGAFGWFSSGETRNRFVISTEKTITQAGVDNSSTKLATKHDIVMASAGQGFTRGQTSMLLIDTYVNQSVIVIHSERKILPYLFWNLANRYEELRAISDSSSIRGSLTTKMIDAFEIPLADEESLQAFADFAWSVIPQIENNLLENERLAALRDSLLPKLMSGEIDASDIQL